MKLAILSDVHANLAALHAVADDIDRWQPDYVIVGGDVINRGPRPRECLDFVLARTRTHGWTCVLGNHEEYVISHSKPEAMTSGPLFEMSRISYWTYGQLGRDVSAVAAWPFAHSTWIDGLEVRVVHASMSGTRAGIHRSTPDEELRHKIAPPPAVLIVGHTHLPLIRHLDATLVVNAGAAGLPFDGDPRAAYARLTRRQGAWQADIVRLAYDAELADRDFEITGFIDQAGPLAPLVRDELRCARSHLFEWSSQFADAVRAGTMTVDAAARRYLAERQIAI